MGYTELIVTDNCDFEDFYSFARHLKGFLKIRFKDKLDGLDDLYWTFDFDGCEMVLCYNIYLGVSICPDSFKNASEKDNLKIKRLYDILK